jgi:hypothetical protein
MIDHFPETFTTTISGETNMTTEVVEEILFKYTTTLLFDQDYNEDDGH